MQNKVNYSLLFENKLKEFEAKGEKPSLLLHACCAPCSSYVLEYIAHRFNLTLYFYNPNIAPSEEYEFRFRELQRLLAECGYTNVNTIRAEYHPEEFSEIAKGLENEPEGGARCYQCYRLRLQKTAEEAKMGGFDYFTTTLSISPHKNADWLNQIGTSLEEEYGVSYLCSDFKKKGGYQRSIALSREYSLYRQDYCGCIYSKISRENQIKNAKESNHAQ